MVFLYIPFLYTFHTRLLSLASKFAWFTTFIFPVLLVCFYFKLDLFFSILLIFLVYSSYEIGYIFNDCEVIKKEKNPTKRLSEQELLFYESHKWKILFVRFLGLIFLNSIVLFFYYDFFIPVFLLCFLILLTYFFYNNIRNNLNLPIYSILVYLRYFAFFSFVEKDLFLASTLFLVYPLCVTLEFSSKSRFLTSKYIKINNFDKFRVVYYFYLSVFALILFSFTNLKFTNIFLYLAFYFFIYRLLSYKFLSKRIRNT